MTKPKADLMRADHPNFIVDTARLLESMAGATRKPVKRAPKPVADGATRAKPKVTARGAAETKRAASAAKGAPAKVSRSK